MKEVVARLTLRRKVGKINEPMADDALEALYGGSLLRTLVLLEGRGWKHDHYYKIEVVRL